MQPIKSGSSRLLFWLLCCWACGTGAEPAPSSAAPFAWTVRASGSSDLPATEHLLIGSVHLLTSDAAELPAGLQQAYARTRGLILETNPAALQERALQKRVRKASKTARGETLSQLIEPALYQQVRQSALALDLPAGYCDHFRPWFCALSLELQHLHREGLDSRYGIDHQFYTRAKQEKRSVRWLEPAADQMALFTDMDEQTGSQFLTAALRGLADPAGRPAELLRQWRENDQNAMSRSVADMQRDYPAIYQRVLLKRNLAWMAPLQDYLQQTDAQMIIVGAAHLVGPHGLPALLAARGWQVEPLSSAVAAAARQAPIEPPSTRSP